MALKKLIILFLVAVLTVVALIISYDEKSTIENSATDNKKLVMVSTYPLYDISKHILKDRIALEAVLPFGSDAHSYELSPKKMARIQDADLFVYSGASLEPWISRFSTSMSLNMSKYVSLIHMEKGHHHHHDDEHTCQAHHEVTDPHYWLDLQNMKVMTEVLTKKFIELSQKDRDFFEKNKKAYLKDLENMQKLYEKSFKECKKDTIVVNHNAFSYLGEKYGFNIESISGLSNDSLPSPKDIRHIMDLVQQKDISVIFFESFASDRIVKSIAKDTGVKVDILYPLGNITKDQQGMTYKEIMQQNIQKIQKALECR